MEDLLVKIYQSVIINEEESVRMGEKYDEQINEIVNKYEKHVAIVDEEQLYSLIYDVAYVTEEGGFVLGARFMARFLFEVLQTKAE